VSRWCFYGAQYDTARRLTSPLSPPTLTRMTMTMILYDKND